jgi:hypothetical protein
VCNGFRKCLRGRARVCVCVNTRRVQPPLRMRSINFWA